MFFEKGVIRNFAKFTGKHLCHSLFFNKVAGQVTNPEKKKFMNVDNLITVTRKVKRIEKEIALNNSKKTIAFKKKLCLTGNIISIT